MPRRVFGLWATQTVATNNITLHGHAEIWKFPLEYQLDIPLIQWAEWFQVEHDNRNPIQYLQGTMYSLVYYINTLLSNKKYSSHSFDSGLKMANALP